MERRPRRFTFIEEAGLRLRDYWGAILAAAGLCLLLAGLLFLAVRAGPGSGRAGAAEEALVLRFGHYDSRWRRRPVAIVRTRDGAVRQLLASPQALRHCRKGSRIRIVRRGAGVFVHSEGCPAPPGGPPQPARM
jgi:hypothetical protein